MPTDSAAIVINEAAVRYLGFKEPIGATANYLYSNRPDNRFQGYYCKMGVLVNQ